MHIVNLWLWNQVLVGVCKQDVLLNETCFYFIIFFGTFLLFLLDYKLRRKLNISTIALGYVTKHQWRCSLLEAFLKITIVRSIKCSTSVLVFCCLLTNHMIYLKLRQKVLLLQAEQISFLRKSSLWVKIVNNLWICIAFNTRSFCLSLRFMCQEPKTDTDVEHLTSLYYIKSVQLKTIQI